MHKCSREGLSVLNEDVGMGFRDLARFNIVLLAKQWWRLLVHPTSIMARLIRANYFPNSRFLDASLRSNPSLVWRSM